VLPDQGQAVNQLRASLLETDHPSTPRNHARHKKAPPDRIDERGIRTEMYQAFKSN
jgi:hypothetical protein